MLKGGGGEDNVVNIKAREIAELIVSLTDQQQAEIFSSIADKKRINELEAYVMRQMKSEGQRAAA